MKSMPQETPHGFLQHAHEILIAAELVINRSQGVSLPGYFLYGRSIELSLKAYLLANGVTIKDLRSLKKFGHDLEKLLAEAMKRRLDYFVPLDNREVGVVHLLNHDYAGKTFEYRVTDGTYYLPLIDVTENVARKLVSGLRERCSKEFANGGA